MRTAALIRLGLPVPERGLRVARVGDDESDVSSLKLFHKKEEVDSEINE